MNQNSIRKWGVRALVSLALPFLLVCSFFARLYREIRSAFWFAWLDVCMDIDAFLRMWRTYDGSEESANRWKETQ